MPKDIKIAIVAITDGAHNLLMIRRVKKEGDDNGGKWECPAGHIDPGEIPAVAAVREVKEETGLDIFLIPHGIIIPTKKGKAAYYLGFVQGDKVKPKIKLAPDEHDRYLWVKAEDFDKVKPTHKRMKENLIDLLTNVSEKLHVSEKTAQRIISSFDYWALGRQYEKLQRIASTLKQKKEIIMKRQRRIKAQGNTTPKYNHVLPGPGEELKEAILVGDEVEIFLKKHVNGNGKTPEPSISGVVEQRDRNTIWIHPTDDDERQLVPVNWDDRGNWAFVRVFRGPDQVVYFASGNPYDEDSKAVSNAKGLGLILESAPPARYEAVWALMRGETPDLDRSMGQVPESMDIVAPTNKPKPGTPAILTQVQNVIKSHGFEPDGVSPLGKGRVLILTQDGDLKKELIKVLEKHGKKVDASLRGRLIVRQGNSLSTMGTTTVPIATDDDLLLMEQSRQKRERQRDQKRQSAVPATTQQVMQQGQMPGQMPGQMNQQNQQQVLNPGASFVIPKPMDQTKAMEDLYGPFKEKNKLSDGTVQVIPNPQQTKQMADDMRKQQQSQQASRKEIRQVAASLAQSLRDQEYDDSSHYISELRALGVKASSIVRSSIASRKAWGHLHRYLEATGEIENSRIARTAARVAPDL